MASSAYVELRERYRTRFQENTKIATHVAERVRAEIERQGIYATVTFRAKDPDSFATKALLGGYADPMGEIGDQAGVRVTVSYLADVDKVEDAVRAVCDVRSVEDKLGALEFNEVGYLGRHLDTRLSDSDVQALGPAFAGFPIEVQVRTTAQSAWAEVSHEQLYKPSADVPRELKRRVFRLVALVELFDQEIAGFVSEARLTPGYAEAAALRPSADALLRDFDGRRRPDRQLSLIMAAALVPLYNVPPEQVFEVVLDAFIRDHRDRLDRTLREAETEGSPNPLLHQPEVFALFERLQNDRLRVQTNWPEEVPEEWLRDAAARWAVRLGEE